MTNTRTVHDSMGAMTLPENALYGAQTQRAIENFPISHQPMPKPFILALAEVKLACAKANHQLGLMSDQQLNAIEQAVKHILCQQPMDAFPVDVFQTGSGTSSNMNMNEVISTLAEQLVNVSIHPNDHVNMSQSSNDVIPTALHVSANRLMSEQLLPAINHLIEVLANKELAVVGIVKTGRTHLMDAMPITLSQELSGWRAQLSQNLTRLTQTQQRLKALALGGTAVGTGINAPTNFSATFCKHLSEMHQDTYQPMDNFFVGLSSQDTVLELSGQLNVLAASLMKIANDLRWMNSGPLAGLAEIQLPALQPGSSIMPGKVNPVIPEAVAMVCAQVTGNHTAITIGAQSGNFQLNVMLPMITYNLLNAIEWLSNAMYQLADKAIQNFKVNLSQLDHALAINPILVTALNGVVGYEKGAEIAKTAYQTGQAVIDVAEQLTDLDRDTLMKLLDPKRLTEGGTPGL
ncbi:class II fumarate hydratase [Thiomicrospira cyclica]|uniref:Fumarate hydratase class II n=1 Tax=Thiomicrospira cyclica (strain DSM 14477 / JCM 11371 / ALM1) TaxID=717773 RepID=F6D8G3_THICA|nr:class II fumarate hydratase [Thiomicrospira cyclica]AEG31814.1 Fumarate hydratase class II [Thiomicrospira cyclica ALM1]